ncbi:Hypothetical_protein [Hexamita inflata]|uniref:Hypothetical_protein n=1 Tax=Hexamita inflata TaxID=28002 RepID=A0AA86U2A5_9EUKA|nr:Hypothetical protein HINF_LOCUS12242 [Hexamita inflata]CAI9937271.1 Hypothetical protein HINF_LOCUS24916 [Hexamita inflata]
MPQVIILSIDCGAKNSGIAVHYPQSNQTTMVSISGNSPGTKSSSTMYIKLNTSVENLTINNIFFEGQRKIPHEEDIYSVSDYKQVLVNGGLEVLAKNVQSEEDVPIPIIKIMELFFGQVKFLLDQILEDEIYEVYVIFPIFQLTASTKQIIVEAMNTAFDFKEENAVKTNQTPKITLIHEATACCLIEPTQPGIYIGADIGHNSFDVGFSEYVDEFDALRFKETLHNSSIQYGFFKIHQRIKDELQAAGATIKNLQLQIENFIVDGTSIIGTADSNLFEYLRRKDKLFHIYSNGVRLIPNETPFQTDIIEFKLNNRIFENILNEHAAICSNFLISQIKSQLDYENKMESQTDYGIWNSKICLSGASLSGKYGQVLVEVLQNMLISQQLDYIQIVPIQSKPEIAVLSGSLQLFQNQRFVARNTLQFDYIFKFCDKQLSLCKYEDQQQYEHHSLQLEEGQNGDLTVTAVINDENYEIYTHPLENVSQILISLKQDGYYNEQFSQFICKVQNRDNQVIETFTVDRVDRLWDL